MVKMNHRALNDLLEQIESLAQDSTVPRTIKNALTDVKECLINGDCDFSLRKDDAQIRLADIADDPNIPINGRTVVWDVLSRIESL